MNALRPSNYLTDVTEQPRARRAADVTTVVIGLTFAIWGVLAFRASDPLQQTLASFAAALPEWAVAVLSFGYTLGLILAILIVVLLIVYRRWSALRDVLIAAVAASAVTVVLVAIYDELWPPFFTEFMDEPTRLQFPVVRVAMVSAILVAATPYVARPLRRLGWAIVIIICIAAIALALSVPSGAISALGIGMVCGSGVLLIFGSPLGYPNTEAVRAALSDIGISVPDLQIARDQSWGVRRLVGTDEQGARIEVKAYGRDATDSAVMAKLWHAAMYRGRTRRWSASRLESVEHEAVVTMLAAKSGAPVVEVLAAASANEEVAVLVTSNPGVPLSTLSSVDHITDGSVVDLWRSVDSLHRSGITHGSLTADAVHVTDDGFVLAEFDNGSVVFSETEASLDRVHLLFTTAVAFGTDRAVSLAIDGLGKEKLASTLGYLQPPALGTKEKRAVKGSSKFLKELRARVSAETGVEIPEPVKLRRISRKGVLTLVLVCFFASALIPLLTGVDYAAIWSSLQSATWWLALTALLLGQIAFIPQGTAMMCAVGRSIPLRPMTILQPAVAFISFAVPGMAGRVTMESAFLYKFGVAPTVSVTKGALDAFSGFLVQCVILVIAFLTGALVLPASSSSATTNSSTTSTVSPLLALLVVGIAVVTVIVVLRVEKIRSRVVPEIKKAWEALTEVARSPRLALGLLGSQVAVQFMWGMALWVALVSMGTHLSLISCMSVVVATSLLQGIIPVPGGIGVSEAVMSGFLVPLGVSGEVAMGATIIWRVATFYLPAIEGFFAAKYLERRGYL